LLFTDTDLLCCEIGTRDLYEDFGEMLDELDTAISTRVFPSIRRTTVGCWASSRAKRARWLRRSSSDFGQRCTEVQMYGDSRKSVKKAKGIQKHYVKKEVNHNQFLDVLRRDRKHIRAKFRNFKSTNHVVSTLEINKLCLSPFDDKRYILKDGIQTLAYGHYSLRKASCPHSVETP